LRLPLDGTGFSFLALWYFIWHSGVRAGQPFPLMVHLGLLALQDFYFLFLFLI